MGGGDSDGLDAGGGAGVVMDWSVAVGVAFGLRRGSGGGKVK